MTSEQKSAGQIMAELLKRRSSQDQSEQEELQAHDELIAAVKREFPPTRGIHLTYPDGIIRMTSSGFTLNCGHTNIYFSDLSYKTIFEELVVTDDDEAIAFWTSHGRYILRFYKAEYPAHDH